IHLLVSDTLASARAPSFPIEFQLKYKVVKVVLILSASDSARAPSFPIEFRFKYKVVKV
ncbi:hypothetical protein BGZ49_005758, partial [Haplosporangium sp. Z 27]